jgi:hypothetical protein
VTEKITYAIVGGPPDCWALLKVTLNGVEQDAVTEVNSEEGWLIRCKRDHFNRFITEIGEDGEPSFVKERLEGRIEIRLGGSF